MKICIAQTRPFKGDIPKNVSKHKKLIELAAASGADIIVFPELSLTGYEPCLAQELALHRDDVQFEELQRISEVENITVCAGIPLKSPTGILISMLIFQPGRPGLTYSKRYLHEDELPYFVPGSESVIIVINDYKIAPAICYEISVPQHTEHAQEQGALIYLASIAKTAEGVSRAIKRLSAIAKENSMFVFMSNYVGLTDGEACGGRSSVWDDNGNLKGQLNDTSEGIMIFDLRSKSVVEKTL